MCSSRDVGCVSREEPTLCVDLPSLPPPAHQGCLDLSQEKDQEGYFPGSGAEHLKSFLRGQILPFKAGAAISFLFSFHRVVQDRVVTNRSLNNPAFSNGIAVPRRRERNGYSRAFLQHIACAPLRELSWLGGPEEGKYESNPLANRSEFAPLQNP